MHTKKAPAAATFCLFKLKQHVFSSLDAAEGRPMMKVQALFVVPGKLGVPHSPLTVESEHRLQRPSCHAECHQAASLRQLRQRLMSE